MHPHHSQAEKANPTCLHHTPHINARQTLTTTVVLNAHTMSVARLQVEPGLALGAGLGAVFRTPNTGIMSRVRQTDRAPLITGIKVETHIYLSPTAGVPFWQVHCLVLRVLVLV